MKHLSNDHKDCSNQHKNSHKLCHETEHLILSLVESQWKLRPPRAGFELTVRNSQFAKHFGSLRINFYIFSKNCKSLKSDTSWIFRVIHWTSYIRSYFKPNKYPLLNNNVISQRFIVHINFKLHTSFISIILLRSSKL